MFQSEKRLTIHETILFEHIFSTIQITHHCPKDTGTVIQIYGSLDKRFLPGRKKRPYRCIGKFKTTTEF
ncbi:MAG: hypothetical protein EMLJLAPB_01007 [Candidatus Argoarchaeum ethanivorans]|uniref:Uncharacterized protein n=1 Tax=Candidatus Argoarchaeum ethanivorans TaxID=2608793 RepID=A0A811TBM9_9EURY|nr:MAG: hypothetical protein EMLJLAPB_01007 [Candidatus Argoarchaeum ethanivorans]